MVRNIKLDQQRRLARTLFVASIVLFLVTFQWIARYTVSDQPLNMWPIIVLFGGFASSFIMFGKAVECRQAVSDLTHGDGLPVRQPMFRDARDER